MRRAHVRMSLIQEFSLLFYILLSYRVSIRLLINMPQTLFMHGQVKPFMISSAAAYRLPPPPPLNSSEFWQAFDTLMVYGEDDSTDRTSDQTMQAIFWGHEGTPYTGYATGCRARGLSIGWLALTFFQVRVS